MQRFKNILIVLDNESRNEALIDRAVTLCQRNQASLTVVTVAEEISRDDLIPVVLEPKEVDAPAIDIIETLPFDIPTPTESDSADAPELFRDPHEILYTEVGIPDDRESSTIIHEQINEAETRQLEQVIALIRSLGVQVSSKVLHGTPFIAIIREVLMTGHDLVMIAAEDRRSLKNVLFGTTTMHLMRKCPCPVWVMKPDQLKQQRSILAAVDPTPSDEERNALNNKIMELATSLSHRERCELLIIHAWSFAVESHMRSGRITVSQSTLDKWIENSRLNHKRMLAEFLQQYEMKNLNHQVFLLKGEAWRLIPALVAAKEVDLIVMGSVCRTGVSGLLIGNTAEKVLNQVDCSVLTVKPDGFITPIKLEA